MKFKKTGCIAVSTALILITSGCGIMKKTKAAESVSSSSVTSPTTTKSSKEELFEKWVYDEGEPEIYVFGNSPEHYYITEKYFTEEEEGEKPKSVKKDGIYYNIYSDHAVCTGDGYKNEGVSGVLVIPSEIDNVPVTEISAWAFDETEITSVILPETMAVIGEEAFAECKLLEEAVVYGNMEERAFRDCNALKKVVASGDIGDYAFERCISLETVEMLSGKKIGHCAFDNSLDEGCKSLSEFTASEELEFIGEGAFFRTPFDARINNCNETIILGKVIYKYGGDKNSEVLEVSEGITMLGSGVFSGMEKVKKLILPDSLKYIGGDALSGMESLEELNLPDSVEYIGPNGCMYMSSIKKLTMPMNLKHLGSQAFSECISLEEIVFNEKLSFFGQYALKGSKWADEHYGVVIVNGVVVYCNSNHKSYTIPEGVVAVAPKAFSQSIDDSFHHSFAQYIELPDTVEYIGEEAFWRTNILEFDFPDNLRYIGDRAFMESFCIEEITLKPYIEEIGVYNFAYCTDLETVKIESGRETIPDYFCYETNSIKTIIVPNTVEYFGKGSFYGMTESCTVYCSAESKADYYFKNDRCEIIYR